MLENKPKRSKIIPKWREYTRYLKILYFSFETFIKELFVLYLDCGSQNTNLYLLKFIELWNKVTEII